MEDLLSEISEKQLSGKEKLKLLEDCGRYVFHGSHQPLEEFEPRQAKTLDENGNEKNDGPPAVFASTLKDPAILRALVNHHTDPTPGHWSGWDNRDGEIKYKAVKSGIDKANEEDHRGYVHVFDREKFTPLRSFEVAAYENVRPVTVVEVKGEDLPENIEIVEPL